MHRNHLASHSVSDIYFAWSITLISTPNRHTSYYRLFFELIITFPSLNKKNGVLAMLSYERSNTAPASPKTTTRNNLDSVFGDRRAHGEVVNVSIRYICTHKQCLFTRTNSPSSFVQTLSPAASSPPATASLRSSPCRAPAEVPEKYCNSPTRPC